MPTSADRPWRRSPCPVRVGAYTSCRSAPSRRATSRQHQPPCMAPCTSTNLGIVARPRPPASPATPVTYSAPVRIGVTFPQTEIGADPGAVRAYAQRVEELGFSHLLAYDHVVGADPAVHQGWNGPYDITTTFHEPFVVFGYLAAITSLELVTDIIILPQRQTALVAKQATEVDLLTEGRFRLGVGLGWNAVEYEALGKDFTHRGRRMEEQIDLLRQLWTEPTLTFEGRYETVTGAGLAPLPLQQPI